MRGEEKIRSTEHWLIVLAAEKMGEGLQESWL